MEIYLTYRGKIPSRKKDLNAVWAMRWNFHLQLCKLRGKEPFKLLDGDYYQKAIRNFGGHSFAPLYGKHTHTGVGLDIVLLSGVSPRQAAIENGDLDNRLKRIVDALRMPTQTGEIPSTAGAHSNLCYCLLDDDDSVLNVTVKLSPYLNSDDPSESLAIVQVRAIPTSVTMDNLAMLF